MSSIDELKTMYKEIRVPDELDIIVQSAMERGRIAMKNKQRKKGYLKVFGSFAAVFLIFAIALNTVPVFANSVKQLPGGETIVRLLTFVGDTATGGKITDGQDIKQVKAGKAQDYETLTVELYQGAAAAVAAGHFTVTHQTHPYSIVVGLAGVRAFSAVDAFPDLSGMKLLDDIYRLVTLDDSAHRFVVTFKKPVIVEVSEQQNPARIIIRVKEDSTAVPQEPMYSLRTASFPFGEMVGIAENILAFEMGSEKARLLRDDSGLYLAEEGLYRTKAEAEARMAEIKQFQHFLYQMHIEKREPEAKPGMIPQ